MCYVFKIALRHTGTSSLELKRKIVYKVQSITKWMMTHQNIMRHRRWELEFPFRRDAGRKWDYVRVSSQTPRWKLILKMFSGPVKILQNYTLESETPQHPEAC